MSFARKRRSSLAVLVAATTALTACNLIELLPSRPSETDDAGAPLGSTRTATAPPPIASTALPLAGLRGLPSFAPLVKKAKPAIVLVRALSDQRDRDGERKKKLGTGFFYDNEGRLLTNNHVIDGADDLEVKLADGRILVARVVGTDPPTDVAILKVDKGGLPALPLGDSEAIQVGDWVVAIGNPFGLEHTVSAGILSAKGRTVEDMDGLDPTGYFDFLQTDASINPGNSGGPLLNLAGQVVGINAAIRANANNIGFAIPMEMVVQLIPKLVKDGRVRRSAIGIFVAPITAAERERLGLTKGGARVSRVLSGQAAQRAGVKDGDIITDFGGHSVKGPEQLRWLASIAGVGRTVKVKLVRDGKRQTLALKLGALDD